MGHVMDLNEHKKWVYYFKKRNLGVWALKLKFK